MTKRNSTKRALLTSVLSLLLCFSMLVGTTFAWFTDSVTSAGNVIATGNLKVDLEVLESDNKTWTSVKESKAPIFNYENWEPGYVQVKVLRVVNEGSLALKWKARLTSESELSILADVIDVYVKEGVTAYPTDRATIEGWTCVGTLAEFVNNIETTTTGEIKAKAADETEYPYEALGIAFKMREDAGNDYQDKTLGKFTLQILATQLTAENDSFNDQYDADSEFDGEISTVDALIDALTKGGTYKVMNDLTLDSKVSVPAGVTVNLDLGGKKIDGAFTRSEGALIENNGMMTIANGTVENTTTNGSSAILNKGVMELSSATIVGAPSDTSTGTAAYAVNTEGEGSVLTVNNTSISGRGAIGATNGAKVEINGGTYHTPTVAWGHAVYAYGDGTEVVINDGTFSEGYEMSGDNWGMYQIYSGNNAKVVVNGGTFMEWDCANGYDLCTASGGTIEVYSGTFAEDPSNQNNINYVTDGCVVLTNDDGTYSVYGSKSTMTLADGAVLDLGGVAFPGTIVAEGDLTIKGDTTIKTLSATNGGTITVEDGKTLTLNNFSFGAKGNADAKYIITGGTVEANYGFFQHGTYELRSDFETGYMYYSFGSDITVYGTFHSKGTGDGLDYVRGKLTIAKGGKTIHDKSLWVGQPASWGTMSATLIVEEGGYVQANHLSVYAGSTLQIDAESLPAGEVTSIVCNKLTADGTIEAINNDDLTATVSGNKIVLE